MYLYSFIQMFIKKLFYHPLAVKHLDLINETARKMFTDKCISSLTFNALVSRIYDRLKKIDEIKKEGGCHCQICGLVYSHNLSHHLRHIHKINTKDYKITFPDSPTLSEKILNEMSERVKGENNPSYNHGGKHSPFSRNFIHYKHLSDEEVEKKIREVCDKNSISNKENGNTNTTIEYWLKQGYSEEEAKRRQSERQTTFSLEICIEKHGKEEGTRIWKERQDKWQKSLLSKEDYEEMNKRKDSASIEYFRKKYPDDPEKAQEEYNKRVMTNQWCKKECSVEEDVPGTLYYIYFWNDDIEFWKIGITRKSIEERFWEGQYSPRFDLNKKVIKTWQGLYINECYRKEQEILAEMVEWRIKIDHNNFSTSEAFSKDISLLSEHLEV